eukprot:GEMP01015832.1.p1 GENE.GEMP01015832.1~~GEMP01015832.1.p1  ORF type:complete len:639 (+),score=133.74 GEMP01015832.1:418-2334(+)
MACCSRCSASRSFYGQPKKAAYISCNVTYPMYCVPLTVALEMDAVESHEALLARDVLVEHHPDDAKPVIFVSHQWVSKTHPDPDFTQFAILQKAIRRLLDGYEVRSDWFFSLVLLKDKVINNWDELLSDALVWYDYFSVPQAAANREFTKRAIESISTYIEMAAMIFVLAPTVDHRDFVDANKEALLCDYYSWELRGWCRLEVFGAHLKVNSQPLMVIRSEGQMYFRGAGNLAHLARVAEGEFMCCTLNHQFVHSDGTVSPIPCDKPPVFGVLTALITSRLRHERKKGNLRKVRQILAHRHIWLRDLLPAEESYNASEATLSAFMVSYEFASPREFDRGWTPLRFACISGNVNVARQLIEERADVEAYFKSPCPDFLVEKGMSILFQILMLCCCAEHEEILDLLVKHNAKLSSSHGDALAYASASLSPRKRGARWLFRTFPDRNVNLTSYGPDGVPRWPLKCAMVTNADIDYVRDLCAHKADLTLQDWPLAADVFQLSCSLCPSSSPDISEYILQELQKRAMDNDALSATTTDIQPVPDYVNGRLAAPWATRMVLKLGRASALGPTAYMDLVLCAMGSTPLISAAKEGKHRVCKWLIEQKADTSIANADGETPLSIAQKRGFTRVVDVLCSTSAHERV